MTLSPRLLLPRPVAISLLSLCVALFTFHPMTPAVPQWGLDASWVTVMGEAADRHLRWGLDLAFPYGPASSLLTGYEDSRYLTRTLPIMLASSLAFGWGAVLVFAAGQDSGRSGIPAAAVGSLAIAIAGTRGFPDITLLMLPLLPFLLIVTPSRASRAGALAAAVLAFVVGVSGMAKMSIAILTLPLFAMGDVSLLIRRRVPCLLLCFIIGFASTGASLGQTFEDLPVSVALQWDVVAGYSEAMAVDGDRLELLAFVIAAGLLLVVAAWTEAKAARSTQIYRRWGLLRVVGLALVVFMLFKAGFVRQDLHTLIAWNGLAMAILLTLWARIRFWPRRLAIITLSAALAIIMVLCPAMMTASTPRGARMAAIVELYDAWLLTEPIVQLKTAATALVDPPGFAGHLVDIKTAAVTKITDLFPLPGLEGRVDTIPSMQSRIIANGLDYAPRPSFQEYSTYTQGLAEANRRFIEGPLAPEWILFGPEPGGVDLTIDARYSNFAEGALWPDLLRLYRPERRIETWLALKRRDQPSPTRTGDWQRTTVGFNQPVEVAEAPATFVKVAARPSFLGRLAGLLFRPAPLTMAVLFADGHRHLYQFITGIGAAGFVISPLVQDADGFLALAAGEPASPDHVAVAFSIDALPKLQRFYEPDITIETTVLHVEPARIDDAVSTP